MAILCLLILINSHAAETKVEFTMPGRPNAVDPAYSPWAVGTVVSASSNFNGITVTLSNVGPGISLKAGWWKDAAESPTMNARMISDGITVDNATNNGGRISMRLAGLTAGPHSLLTYHNGWDNPTNQVFSRMNVYLNGVLATPLLQPTARVTNNYSGATAYLEFNIFSNEVVEAVFEADTTRAADTYTNVWLNGFEIDTVALDRKAILPVPSDKDEHVDGDSRSVLLRWNAASNAVPHRVYFGVDSNAVATATTNSPQFMGSQTVTNLPATNLSSLVTYFWRVDEVHPDGTARGDVWMFRTRHLAFPEAEGYGRFARGGRGGKVVEVTSLADSGPGTLRHALTNDIGPRTVVFAVSGLITLESRLTVNQRYITLAGQTAPGKGICIRKWTLGLSGAQDFIVRHLRVRPGNISGATIDGMGMQGSDHCIFDHCSISWSLDEAFSSRSARNITLQRTLISEALNAAGHQNYPPGTRHGYAASISGGIGSFHHNLLAHCDGRNWSLAGGLTGGGVYDGHLDIRNNVVFNWNTRTTDGGAHEVNFVGNFYQPGPATTYFHALNAQYDGFPGTQQYFFTNNVMPGRFTEANQAAGRTASGQVPTNYSPWVNAPFFPSCVTTHNATNALKLVLSDVGATQPVLDDHDRRVILETRARTNTYFGSATGLPGLPDSQDDVGGWENYPEVRRSANWDSDHDGLPDWWETARGLNPNSAPGDFSDSNADSDDDEYTNLDDYLHWMAGPHVDCVKNFFVDVDLGQLTRGFTNGVVLNVSNATNGSAALLAGSKVARFTPATNFTGIASFRFNVVDALGATMTNTVGVRVRLAGPAALGIRRLGGASSLELTGEMGGAYGLESALTLPSWVPWTNVTASGAMQLLPANSGGETQRFFRALVRP